jgi:tetratricopeptide (TPR) repeat protein
LVEGLPLGLELAASWVRVMSCREIAEQIERNLDVLSAQLADVPDRHRSARAVFEYSWSLLAPEEQQVFMKLAAFPGGFRREAAERVAGAPLSLLFTLVDKSLLRASANGRYDMHSLLHQFVVEKAAEFGQATTLQTRLINYYLDYARQHQHDYLALEEERINLMTCLEMAHDNWQAQVVLDYVEALGEMWSARGHWSDARKGYAWACDAARAHDDNKALAKYLCQCGEACIEQDDYDEATDHLRKSLQLYDPLSDRHEIAHVQNDLARVSIETADYARAADLLSEAYTAYEQLAGDPGIADTLFMQAWLCYNQRQYVTANDLAQQALHIREAQKNRRKCIEILRHLADIAIHGLSDYLSAEQYCYQAIELCQATDEKSELAATLQVLADVHRRQSRLSDAQRETETSLALARQMGLRKAEAINLFRLSQIDVDRGDLQRALREAQQSLALCRALQDRWGMIYILDHLANIVLQINHDEVQSRALWSEALALAQTLKHPLTVQLRQRLGV